MGANLYCEARDIWGNVVWSGTLLKDGIRDDGDMIKAVFFCARREVNEEPFEIQGGDSPVYQRDRHRGYINDKGDSFSVSEDLA